MTPSRSALTNTVVLFVALLNISVSAIAETVYIRDAIYVPLRGGQSNEHRILHNGIRSGTALNRVEQNDESGFSRVITSEGLEGWIQNQYLVTEPIARDQLQALQTRFETLQSDYETAAQNLASESDAASTAAQTIDQLDLERKELGIELSRITELAADVIQIDQKNESLQMDVADLNQQIDDLETMNADLKDTANQTWYMIGAGTILFGILLGFWVARQMHTRHDTGWS
ncbi:MAG: SH3 domain protein [Candidatus Azotimanducaceae bacterium]|jgi:SH3 domain protein